jgi:PPP family 3-phenylpropionic acid transporter
MGITWRNASGIALQGVYWTAFCSFYSYAAVFLLGLSFSSSSIGLLMAGASMLAVILQPAMGHWVDNGVSHYGHSRLKKISLGIVLVAWGSSIGLVLFKSAILPVILLYFTGLTGIIVLQPLFSALILSQGDGGQRVNFGVARAFGSFFYAIGSVLIGVLIEAISPGILPLISTGLIGVLLVVVVSFPEGKCDTRETAANTELDLKKSSGFGFIHQYPGFLKILIGLAFVFVFHTMAGVFLVNVIEANGGTESQLGFALMVMAAVEIPVMIGSNQLMKRFGIKRLFIVAMLCYILRSLGLLMAQDMMGIYFAQMLQACSFAIYIPISVAFINDWMASGDKVKGQTMIVSATTLGSVAGSVFGGMIIDQFGVSAMLLTGTISATIGAGLVIWGLIKRASKENELKSHAL